VLLLPGGIARLLPTRSEQWCKDDLKEVASFVLLLLTLPSSLGFCRRRDSVEKDAFQFSQDSAEGATQWKITNHLHIFSQLTLMRTATSAPLLLELVRCGGFSRHIDIRQLPRFPRLHILSVVKDIDTWWT
jgi:hypothetical protein